MITKEGGQKGGVKGKNSWLLCKKSVGYFLPALFPSSLGLGLIAISYTSWHSLSLTPVLFFYSTNNCFCVVICLWLYLPLGTWSGPQKEAMAPWIQRASGLSTRSDIRWASHGYFIIGMNYRKKRNSLNKMSVENLALFYDTHTKKKKRKKKKPSCWSIIILIESF